MASAEATAGSGVRQAESLRGLVHQLIENTEGKTVTLGELLEAVGMQAFGPLLLVPSLIAGLPVIGAIPGMSVATGTVIVLIAGQVLVGRRQPWLPGRLTGFSFEREPLRKGIAWAEPKLGWLDRFIRPCLSVLVRGPARYAAALVAILDAVLFYPAAFIPFAVEAPAFALIVLAIGMTTADGRWVIAGYTLTLGSLGMMAYLFFSGMIPI